MARDVDDGITSANWRGDASAPPAKSWPYGGGTKAGRLSMGEIPAQKYLPAAMLTKKRSQCYDTEGFVGEWIPLGMAIFKWAADAVGI